MNNYLALLVRLLIRHVHRLNQILFIYYAHVLALFVIRQHLSEKTLVSHITNYVNTGNNINFLI